MNKFTPGPWKFSFESIDPNWAVVTDAHGSIIANVNSETGPDASSAPATRKMPQDANVTLIAAAPDLARALEAAKVGTDWIAATAQTLAGIVRRIDGEPGDLAALRDCLSGITGKACEIRDNSAGVLVNAVGEV